LAGQERQRRESVSGRSVVPLDRRIGSQALCWLSGFDQMRPETARRWTWIVGFESPQP
jgi:hypothetical protein